MRPTTEAETRTVMDGLDTWGDGVGDRVVGDGTLWMDDDSVCLLGPDAARLPDAVRDGAAGGLTIGAIQDDAFILGLQGAVLVAPHARRGVVRVTETASRLFLYHRRILGTSVLWADRKLRPGDGCIVASPRGEALGLGTVVGTLKGKREVIHPLHELGTYLRDQDA